MAARGALARVVLLMVAAAATARAATVAVVTDGYTFHAALAAPNVTWILLANNVSVPPSAEAGRACAVAAAAPLAHARPRRLNRTTPPLAPAPPPPARAHTTQKSL
jgi:hypothetical protein